MSDCQNTEDSKKFGPIYLGGGLAPHAPDTRRLCDSGVFKGCAIPMPWCDAASPLTR